MSVRKVSSEPAVRAARSDAPARQTEAPAAEAGWVSRAVGAKPRSRVDGKAFIRSALADIKERTSRGEKVRVVFDLDNTLADTRARTLAVARAFDRQDGTSHFRGLTLEKVGHDGAETAKAMRLPESAATSFAQYWDREFWKGKNLVHDLPMEETIRLARSAKSAGAEVVYLTGRIDSLRRPTVAQLKRLGLPDADSAHLTMKPSVSVRTAPFKAEQLGKWMGEGFHIGWFFTEGRRDIAHLQSALPKVPCVLLDSHFGGEQQVSPRTPVYPSVF
ncbi:MAG: hypothetical protein HYZ28_09585 [Myxococcales bacterium]|nr:hypothetical protein [Myxococcales bacterium]